jgi:hypothetical protein
LDVQPVWTTSSVSSIVHKNASIFVWRDYLKNVFLNNIEKLQLKGGAFFLLQLFNKYCEMVRCKKQGCQKSARWPSKFCSTHTGGEVVPVTKNVAASKKKEPSMQSGYQCEFEFENEDVINGITNILEEETKDMTKDTEYREFANITEIGHIEPMLQLIVEEAGKQKSLAFH